MTIEKKIVSIFGNNRAQPSRNPGCA